MAPVVHGNGRIWVHDLAQRETRLVAEGIHFSDGLLGPHGWVYLAPFSRSHRGVVRMAHPLAPAKGSR